jgi:tetratricopeptide (TPR) repeat protein
MSTAFDLYTEGLKNLSTGHIAEAEDAFLNAAFAAGDQDRGLAAKAYLKVAGIALRFKNYAESLTLYDAAAAFRALEPTDRLCRAICLFWLDQSAAAKAELTELKALNPNDEIIVTYLARLAAKDGDFETAIAALQGLSGIEAKLDLGMTLTGAGKKAEAQRIYNEVRQSNPDYFQTLMQEVDQLMMLDLPGPATALLEKVESIAPEDANVWFYIGLRYYTLGQTKGAIRAYHKGIKINPLLVLFQELSSLYEKSNDLKAAREALKTPLHYFPNDPKANYVRALVDFRSGKTKEAEAALQQVLPGADNPYTKADILNLLGKIEDKKGNPAEAFQFFQESKDALKATKEYGDLNPASQLDLLRVSQEYLPPNPTSTFEKDPYQPKALVFFVGFPRSGTTLIENVLAGHEEIVTTEERSLLLGPIGMFEKMEGGYPAALKNLTPDQVMLLRARYFREILTFTGDVRGRVLVDKMPLNLIYLPVIRTLFPDAKILFAARHPKAVALSCMMQNFDLNNAMANLMSPGEIARFYEAAITLWQTAKADHSLKEHTFRYEDVVAEMEGEARKITEFLGLNWQPKMLNYASRARDKDLVQTPSYAQVIKPVYKDAARRWTAYEDQFSSYDKHFTEALKLFGYDEARS